MNVIRRLGSDHRVDPNCINEVLNGVAVACLRGPGCTTPRCLLSCVRAQLTRHSVLIMACTESPPDVVTVLAESFAARVPILDVNHIAVCVSVCQRLLACYGF
jgi:hypothetical protein